MQRIVWGSFGKKLLIIMLISAMVPVATFIFGTHYFVTNRLIQESKTIHRESFINAVEKIEIDYLNKERTLYSIGNNYEFIEKLSQKEEDKQEIDDYLETQKKIIGVFDALYVTLANGKQYNSAHVEPTLDTRQREWYKEAAKAGTLIWTNAYEDILTGKMVVTAALPLRDSQGKIVGVVGADLSFDKTKQQLKEMKLLDKGQTIIYNQKWDNITYPTGELEKDMPTILETVQDQYSGVFEISGKQKWYVIKETLSFNNWQILAVVEEQEFMKNLIPINIVYLIMGGLVFIFVGMFTNKVTYQITEPLRKLEKGVLEVYKGNYNYRMTLNTHDEFQDVGEAFNKMLEKIEHSQNNIEQKNKELTEMNEQLQEINIELESSLEQLTATSQMLDNSEEKYRLIMENMYDMVFVLDGEGRVSYANKKFLETGEYRVAEVFGKPWHSIGFSKEEYTLMENLIHNEYECFESQLTLKNGKRLYFEVNSKHIVKDGLKIGTQVVLRDITTRKATEASLQKRNQELSLINKISGHLNTTMNLDKLLAGIAKDMSQMQEVKSCSVRLLEKNRLVLKAFSSELEGWRIEPEIEMIAEEELAKISYAKVIDVNALNREHTFGMMNKENRAVIRQNGIQKIMYIPIKNMEKVNGMITIMGSSAIKDNVSNIALSISQQLAMMIDNIKLYQKQQKQYLKTIKALVAAEEAKDKYTEGHSMRVAKYTRLIAEKMNLEKSHVEAIEAGAILHDIGKIGISDGILNKTGKLTDEEYRQTMKHPEIGYRILQPIEFDPITINGVLLHRKNYDLTGYPKDVILDKLPLEAAIIGVADSFDAMTSSRSYRKALDIEVAKKELLKNKGTQFNPQVVDIFIDLLESEYDKVVEIINETTAGANTI